RAASSREVPSRIIAIASSRRALAASSLFAAEARSSLGVWSMRVMTTAALTRSSNAANRRFKGSESYFRGFENRGGQGHSILITSGSAICQDAVEIHGVAPQGVGNVVDVVEPQDVEGEAAQDGEDGGAFADPAGVLVHGDVEHVVDPVLHPPV